MSEIGFLSSQLTVALQDPSASKKKKTKQNHTYTHTQKKPQQILYKLMTDSFLKI